MKASALMFELRAIINKHGDLPILVNDSNLERLILVDENGIKDEDKPFKIILR